MQKIISHYEINYQQLESLFLYNLKDHITITKNIRVESFNNLYCFITFKQDNTNLSLRLNYIQKVFSHVTLIKLQSRGKKYLFISWKFYRNIKVSKPF